MAVAKSQYDRELQSLIALHRRLAEAARHLQDTAVPASLRDVAKLVQDAGVANELGAKSFAEVVLSRLQAGSQALSRFLVTPDPADAALARKAVREAGPALAETLEQLDPGPLHDQGETATRSLAGFAAELEQVVAMTAAQSDATRHVFEGTARAMTARMQAARSGAQAALAEVASTARGNVGGVRLQLGGIAGIGLLLGAVLALAIARSLIRPLRALTGVMTRLADGDTTVDVPMRTLRTEIGDMARAVEVFKTNALTLAGLDAERAAARAEAETARRADLASLAEGFEGSVRQTMQAVGATATRLTAMADRLQRQRHGGDGADGIRRRRCRADDDRHGGRGGRDRGGAWPLSVGAIARYMAESTQMLGAAASEADRSTQAMETLGDAAAKVGQIISIISGMPGGTDQPAGAECHNRGGPRGRCGQGLRGGGQRGEGPGQPDSPGHRGHQGADRRHAGGHGNRLGGHRRHRREGEDDRRGGVVDRGGSGAAGGGDPGDRRQHPGGGGPHTGPVPLGGGRHWCGAGDRLRCPAR